MFSTIAKTNFNLSVKFILSSASALNLNWSKTLKKYTLFKTILTFNNLTLSKRQILDSSKLGAFADDNIKFDEKGRKFAKRVENTVGKGRISHNEQFFLFPQCFQKTCTADT